MGDFLLDFREPSRRSLKRAGERMRFSAESRVFALDEPGFGLVLTQVGDAALWGPYRAGDGSWVAIAGRAAFDELDWACAAKIPGEGGLAAKIIYERYRSLGVEGLKEVNGNCAVVVYDAGRGEVHLVADRAGMFPVFEAHGAERPIYCSHPDILAETADERHRLDEISMAEFVLTSTVSPPYTYYERIRAVDYGTIFTMGWKDGAMRPPVKRRYFEFVFEGDPGVSEEELADELADALRRAVRRRTTSRMGRTAVALSGGLDSRALLACMENKEQAFAFFCYNERNQEFGIAERIAEALGVRFVPLQREFDYYGDNAEMGVRISGGMGSFANNHFLGMIGRLRGEGMENLVTGCYCDYLFKGLPLNRRSGRLTGREELAPFSHQFYFNHHIPSTALAARVRERWESRIPRELQTQDSVNKVFQLEVRRTFPLCYEGDNQQRVVPQRLTGWCPPVADRDVLSVYRKLPYHFKMNRSIFLKAVLALSDSRLAGIPDANTGARPGASAMEKWVASNLSRVRRKLKRLQPSMTTNGSWPNWHYYASHSRKLEQLWQRPNPDAVDFYRRVLGPDNFSENKGDYSGSRVFLFVSLLNLKLWLDQRR